MFQGVSDASVRIGDLFERTDASTAQSRIDILTGKVNHVQYFIGLGLNDCQSDNVLIQLIRAINV